MRESFLHFIWRFQKFDNIQLLTTEGQAVQIYSLGNYNTNAGPDFLNAKLLIGDITWYGHIEIHLRSSDWNKHKHQFDEAYNNVVLHVVWEHDEDVYTQKGQLLAVLELQERIKPDLLKKCNQLIKSHEKIPCSHAFESVKSIDKYSMLDQAGVSRLRQKSEYILQLLANNKGDWEVTTYQMLAKNFGFNTNEEAFSKLAQILDQRTLYRHAQRINDIEALVFGMAGFLEEPKDEYGLALKKEFDYLSKKYKLEGLEMTRAQWKYLRLRPGNFPTVRLAQWAAFVSKNVKIFDLFIHYTSLQQMFELCQVEVSDYWQYHYDFGKPSGKRRIRMGQTSIDLILINTVAPILAAYSVSVDNYTYMDKAIALLQSIKPEKNRITNMWKELSLEARDAFNSQSMIELHNEFCLKKKCLSCKIGVSLINRSF